MGKVKSIATAIGKLLLKEKKDTVGVITGVKATLGDELKKAYLSKTAYKRGTSKGYAEAMAKIKKK